MKIAKIVSSSSHILYVARVLDARDKQEIPDPDDYSFGRFVGIDDGDGRAIGVICDSRLINPEYSGFSSRLGEPSALAEIKRELTDDKKSLIAVLLLGSMVEGAALHEIPKRVLAADRIVTSLEPEEVDAFHRSPGGTLQMRYFPSVISHAGTLSVTLAKTMIEQLAARASDEDRQRLDVMANSLAWKQTFGDSRF